MQRSSSGGCSQSQLSDPKVLATLLIPQIETFLACNTSTKFLILHYPLNHLESVFELRKLLGDDLFKVGGILDSLASDPPSKSRPQKSLSKSPHSNEAIAARNSNRVDSLSKSQVDPLTSLGQETAFTRTYSKIESVTSSFAKADFVLPSTATDAEITTFLSDIWKVLMEKSPFYTPEPDPKPAVPVALPPPPPTPSTPPFFIGDFRDALDRDSGHPVSTYRGSPTKISRLTGNSNSGAGSQNNCEPSVDSKYKYASSIASTKTVKTERGRRRARGEERSADIEWKDFYIGGKLI
jgi:hypothetical protein